MHIHVYCKTTEHMGIEDPLSSSMRSKTNRSRRVWLLALLAFMQTPGVVDEGVAPRPGHKL